MRVLNITNGDGAAEILKASTVSGDVLAWRDPMHHGPFPAGLSLDDLRPLRAKYLAGPAGNAPNVERDFRLRDDHLNASHSYDHVILWFEHDLLDQLQVLQILDWYAEASLPNTSLDIICINSFPGKDEFRGIGELTAEQMATLTDQKAPVTDDMLTLAQNGWAAFRSSDPSDLLTFLDSDLSGLPFLKSALLRHLQEFPWTATGLTRTEQQILSLVSQGVHKPGQLFVQNMAYETALYIGDWRTYSVIKQLCQADLLTTRAAPFWAPPMTAEERRSFQDQRLSLTDLGHQVATGDADAFGLVHRDTWLGGIHLQTGHPSWAWDPARTTLAPHALT